MFRTFDLKKKVFSSCMVVLQYGAVKSVIYLGPKLSIFEKKAWDISGCFF